jgi:deazaflavin-dependent oxidoreductase (nitroreductase family)
VASNGGADRHPLWYLNLRDEPDVWLRVGTQRFPARAETLKPDEKARVWPHLLDMFSPYAGYQQRTEREIPVVRLTRIEAVHDAEPAHQAGL